MSFRALIIVTVAAFSPGLAACSNSLSSTAGSLTASAIKTLAAPVNPQEIGQIEYEGGEFEIGYRRNSESGLFDTQVSRVEPKLTADNKDGLAAKNAVREMFQQTGICKKGARAYAVPGYIKFRGDGTWAIKIRCSG